MTSKNATKNPLMIYRNGEEGVGLHEQFESNVNTEPPYYTSAFLFWIGFLLYSYFQIPVDRYKSFILWISVSLFRLMILIYYLYQISHFKSEIRNQISGANFLYYIFAYLFISENWTSTLIHFSEYFIFYALCNGLSTPIFEVPVLVVIMVMIFESWYSYLNRII
jgi:hypothetical protein